MQARRAHLGDLHEEVHADRPEERQPRREGVDVEARSEPGADVLDAVGQRVGELEVRRRARLLHVIAGDRDRVEARHVLRRVGEDVGDDAHRGPGRVDIRVPHHELFEDVVLDGAGEPVLRHALLFRRDDEEREDRQHGAVHRHRHRYLAERDAVEQGPHVEDRIDRHARQPDIARDARVVGIVAAVGGEVEGDGEAFLAAGEVAAVEGVRLLGRREAGVLADRPGLVDVHRRIGAAHEGRQAGPGVERVEVFEVGGGVARGDVEAFRRGPRLAQIGRGDIGRLEGELGEVGQRGHRVSSHSSFSRLREKVAPRSGVG